MAGNRKVTIEILGEPKSAQKAFQDVEKSAEGLGSRLSKIFGGIGQVAAGFLTANVIQKGVETLKTGISESISAASDLNESLNKNRVLFGDMSGQIEQFANTSAAGFGISKNAALEATGIFGNLFRAMEIGQKPAADMSTKLVGLAGDLASFNNADPSEVLEALRAGLVGETEPLRRYGVNISAAAIAQKALSMGIADSTANLTPAQKAQATYALILEQTSLAQGDFARTSSGLANSERILAAEWQNIIAIVGGVALPLVTTVVVWFAQRLPGAIDTSTRFLRNLRDEVSGPFNYAWVLARDSVLTFIQALQGNWVDSDKVRPIHEIFGALGTSIGAVADILQLIAKGDFDKAFSRLADAVKLDAGVLRNLGSDLATFIINSVKGLGLRLGTAIQNEIASINWSTLPGRLQTFALGLYDAISGDLRNLSWSDIAAVITSGIGNALRFGSGIGAAGISVGGSILSWITGEIKNTDWSGVGATIKGAIGSGLSFAGGLATQGVSLGGQLFDWISGEVTGVDWSGIAGDIRTGIANGFAVFVQGAKGAVSAGQRLYNWIKGEVTSVDWSAVAGDIRDGISSGFTTVQQVAQGAVSIGTRIKDWIVSEIRNGDWSDLGPLIQQKVTEALQNAPTGGGQTAGGGGGGGGGGIFGFLTKQFDDLKLGAQGVADTLKTDLVGSFQNAAQQAGPLTTTLKGLGLAIGGAAGGASTLATNLLGFRAVSAVVNVVFAGLNVVVDFFAQGLDAANTIVRAAIDLFKNWDHPIRGAQQALGDLTDFAERSSHRFDDAFSFMGRSVGDWRTLVGQKIQEVISDISGLPGTIKGYFSDAGTWLSSAGSQIVQGLINGILGSIPGLKAAADKVAHVVDDVVTLYNKIKSPSRLMYERGQQILAGLAQGLSETDAVVAAADSASRQIADAMITGITNGVSSDTMVPRLTKAMLPALLAAQQNAAQALDLAKVSGASDDDLAKLQAKLDAATSLVQRWQEFNQQTVAQFVQEATDAALTQQSQDALVSSWTQTFNDFGSILDGSLIPQLKAKIQTLTDQLKIALSEHVPQEIITGIQAQIAAATTELQQAGQVVQSAVDAGIVQPVQAMTDAAAAKVKALASSMKDKGASLVDSIVAGLESGKIKLQQAAAILPNTVIPQIQQVIQSLQQNLAQALVDGTDPSGIAANIAIMEALLKALGAAVDDTAVKIGDFVEGKGYKTAYGYTNVDPNKSSSSSGGGGGGGGGSSSSGSLPNGTPANLQGYYSTYYTPDELTTFDRNGKAITTVKPKPLAPANFSAVGMTPTDKTTILNVHVGGRVISQQVDLDRQQEYSTTISPVGAMP